MSRRVVVLFGGFSLLHISLAWVSFTRAELIPALGPSPIWHEISSVLAFPLLYLDLGRFPFDPFLLFALANCFLWAAAEAAIIEGVLRALRKRPRRPA